MGNTTQHSDGFIDAILRAQSGDVHRVGSLRDSGVGEREKGTARDREIDGGGKDGVEGMEKDGENAGTDVRKK